MLDQLAEFVVAHPPHSEYQETWGASPLRVRLGLADGLPPREVRSSMLAIVVQAGQVLFIHPEQPSGDIAHLLVGGRPEPGETPEATLIREVGEESGWRVRPRGVIGYRHFHHLGPLQPSMADRPYPDFVQAIYVAEAQVYDSGLLLSNEAPCRFVDAVWAVESTRAEHRPLLIAALRGWARAGR